MSLWRIINVDSCGKDTGVSLHSVVDLHVSGFTTNLDSLSWKWRLVVTRFQNKKKQNRKRPTLGFQKYSCDFFETTVFLLCYINKTIVINAPKIHGKTETTNALQLRELHPPASNTGNAGSCGGSGNLNMKLFARQYWWAATFRVQEWWHGLGKTCWCLWESETSWIIWN